MLSAGFGFVLSVLWLRFADQTQASVFAARHSPNSDKAKERNVYGLLKSRLFLMAQTSYY